MAFRTDPTDPAHMTPEQRRAEVATILAAGFVRLRRRTALPATDAPTIHPVESAKKALEVVGELRLHGHRG